MHKKIIIFFLCIFASNATLSLAQSYGTFSSPRKINEWFTYYYLHHNTELLVPAIKALFRKKMLEKESARGPMIALLSVIFDRNPEKISRWMSGLDDLSLKEKQILWVALDFSHNLSGQKLLRSIKNDFAHEPYNFIVRLLETKETPLLEKNIRSAALLDMLWGGFFASGDERYVQKIIGALARIDDKTNIDNRLIAAAAKWSLTANALDHDRVLYICKKEYKEQTGSIKQALESIIHGAEINRKSFMDKGR